MRTYSVSAPVALALACAISFAAGYSFHLMFGFERKAAHQAIVEAQAFQRVMAGFEPVVTNHVVFVELTKASTVEDLKALQSKYKDSVLRASELFERQASALELPSEKRIAEPFVAEAARIKREVGAWR
jgi:hypothetical protein